MKKLKKKHNTEKNKKIYTVISYKKYKNGTKKDNTLNEKYFFTNPEKNLFKDFKL